MAAVAASTRCGGTDCANKKYTDEAAARANNDDGGYLLRAANAVVATAEATRAAVRTQPSEEERAAVRARYAEKDVQRLNRMYKKALKLVIDKEKKDGETYRSLRTVEFKVPYSTYFGQRVAVVGSCPALGNWDPASAVKLAWSKGNLWTGKVTLSVDCREVEYKYILLESAKDPVVWEPSVNHKLTLAKIPLGTVLTLEDKWGGNVV